MEQQWVGPAIAFLGALTGALLAGLTAAWVNRAKMNADVQARWDAALLDRSSEMVEAARSLRHHAERFRGSGDQEATGRAIDAAHSKLRVCTEQLRLVGTRRVQLAAREVVLHAWSVRASGVDGTDPRAADFGRPPIERFNDALQEFYRSVRAQLRAPDAEDVIHDDEIHLASGSRP
ncbi:hypothetical protein [Actinoplanes sp. L3-i22]|uniref:hypothetical protein n=1 Tax=Actinoplanes sp. L3-i22 TaxID=2836373 RepID=UPI001C75F140|nr:hypothetical protein [Actinoplanes sp. L3-i22]BCY10116.1 hypothetical protein L3i22_052040 [Actinoplanes sp. L3-i22]